MSAIIHGYKPTNVRCPYCGDSHGMLERIAGNRVRYRCWCGASAPAELEPGDEGYEP